VGARRRLDERRHTTGDQRINTFFSRVFNRQRQLESLLCVGLDPEPDRFPSECRRHDDPIWAFNRAIIDATRDIACCYKPQIAHFSAVSAERDLARTIEYLQSLDIPVLLDAKRGDVGSTAERYAAEVFDRYRADAVTINPYLGLDAMTPFLERDDKAVFILCRTSNPGGADVQHLRLDNGLRLYEHIANLAATRWNANGNVALVVGATQPAELARIREITGDMTFLLPGVGAQGGDVAASVQAGQGGGLIVSSSRAILYASAGDDFADAARTVAMATRDAINEHRIAA